MGRYSVGVHKPATLDNAIRQLRLAADDLEAVKSAMEHYQVEQLSINGQAEFIRALERIAVFAENGRHALRVFLRDRGDFGQAEGEPTASPGRTKRAVKKRS